MSESRHFAGLPWNRQPRGGRGVRAANAERMIVGEMEENTKLKFDLALAQTRLDIMVASLGLLRGYVDPGENFDSEGWQIINDALSLAASEPSPGRSEDGARDLPLRATSGAQDYSGIEADAKHMGPDARTFVERTVAAWRAMDAAGESPFDIEGEA